MTWIKTDGGLSHNTQPDDFVGSRMLNLDKVATIWEECDEEGNFIQTRFACPNLRGEWPGILYDTHKIIDLIYVDFEKVIDLRTYCNKCEYNAIYCKHPDNLIKRTSEEINAKNDCVWFVEKEKK